MNLLSRATLSDVRLVPFPHLVVCEALEPKVYAALASSFPSSDIIAGTRILDQSVGNRRYSMPAWPLMLRNDVSPVWKHFLERHTSAEFFQAVVTMFEGQWDSRIAERLKAAAPHSPGLLYRDDYRNNTVLADARIEINSPVGSSASSPRGAHLDTPNRLYSGLFYLRDEADDSIGGELELFRWKSEPIEAIDRFELPADRLERVATIPYRPNQFVLFPQSIFALHGVGIRHPTPHMRRYVFITAEIEEDWLMARPPEFSLSADRR